LYHSILNSHSEVSTSADRSEIEEDVLAPELLAEAITDSTSMTPGIVSSVTDEHLDSTRYMIILQGYASEAE
jgi:hypothetical protein